MPVNEVRALQSSRLDSLSPEEIECAICSKDTSDGLDKSKLFTICESKCDQLMCKPCLEKICGPVDARCPWCKQEINLKNLSPAATEGFKPKSIASAKPKTRTSRPQSNGYVWGGISNPTLRHYPFR